MRVGLRVGLRACACVRVCKHAEGNSIIFISFFYEFPRQVLSAGEARRGCQVHYYPWGVKHCPPEDLTSLCKLRALSVSWSRAPQQLPLARRTMRPAPPPPSIHLSTLPGLVIPLLRTPGH